MRSSTRRPCAMSAAESVCVWQPDQLPRASIQEYSQSAANRGARLRQLVPTQVARRNVQYPPTQHLCIFYRHCTSTGRLILAGQSYDRKDIQQIYCACQFWDIPHLCIQYILDTSRRSRLFHKFAQCQDFIDACLDSRPQRPPNSQSPPGHLANIVGV